MQRNQLPAFPGLPDRVSSDLLVVEMAKWIREVTLGLFALGTTQTETVWPVSLARRLNQGEWARFIQMERVQFLVPEPDSTSTYFLKGVSAYVVFTDSRFESFQLRLSKEEPRRFEGQSEEITLEEVGPPSSLQWRGVASESVPGVVEFEVT